MRRLTVTCAIFIFISGCDTGKEYCNSSSSELKMIIESYQNHRGYDNKKYPLGLFTREHYRAESEFSQKQLGYFACITLEDLSETERISAELLKFVLQDKIDFYKYERFLNPLLSDSGFHSNLNYMIRPFSDYESVKTYLNKLNAIPDFVDQHFVNLREGLEKGVSQPRTIFKGYESTYNNHIVKRYENSYFYSPFKNLPNSLTPQFRRIKQFFESEYFPKARTTIGVSETPNGADYYQNRINFYTTSTKYTVDDIHQIGNAKNYQRSKVQRRLFRLPKILESR